MYRSYDGVINELAKAWLKTIPNIITECHLYFVNNDTIKVKIKSIMPIKCEIIQLENKKAMIAKDVLNGYKFSSNCHVK